MKGSNTTLSLMAAMRPSSLNLPTLQSESNISQSQCNKKNPSYASFKGDSAYSSLHKLLVKKHPPCGIHLEGPGFAPVTSCSNPSSLGVGIEPYRSIVGPFPRCFCWKEPDGTVDGRNPANSPVEGKVVFPIIYKGLYIPGGCLGLLPSTVAPNMASIGIGF